MESFSGHIPSSICQVAVFPLVPVQQEEQFLQDFSFIVMSSLLSGPWLLLLLLLLGFFPDSLKSHK